MYNSIMNSMYLNIMIIIVLKCFSREQLIVLVKTTNISIYSSSLLQKTRYSLGTPLSFIYTTSHINDFAWLYILITCKYFKNIYDS